MPQQAVTPGTRAGLSIPDYELLRPIGRGAYGEVWLARNVTGSWVALKIVQRAAFDHDRPFEREFEGIQRFEPISRSDPSQVAILHVGLGEGFFYYVMELADDAVERSDGVMGSGSAGATTRQQHSNSPSLQHSNTPASYAPLTLKRLLNDRGALPAQECLTIALSLTRALAHLHGHGLVHRDVKPSNVIFVNGQAKLADIGLVTSVDATRSFVGTEGYLPPEGAGTPQADLYSLGKVLYEMSTGCDRKEFPALPPDIATRPDRDALAELNAIVVRACQLDPSERYASAEAMLSDLELLQRGQSVKRRRTVQERIHAARRIVVTTIGVLLAAAGVAFLWQTWQGAPSLASANEDGTAGTRNLKAREAYTIGLNAMDRGTTEGFQQAQENFTTATQADPKFVAAYARLFETYLMGEDHGFAFIDGKTQKLNELSARLVKLAPTNEETHAALAIVRFVNEWKWTEAEAEFKQALRANRNCRMALTYYGYFLTRQGRVHEAREALIRARQWNPKSPLITKFLGHCDFFTRNYEEALQFYMKASVLNPNYPSGHYWAGRAYLAMTNYLEGLEEFRQYELKQGFILSGAKWREKGLRELVEKEGARGLWTKLVELEDADTGDKEMRSPYLYAECYARLGDADRAREWLGKAFDRRQGGEHLLFDEFWDRFRHEPGFKKIVKQVGLEPWAK